MAIAPPLRTVADDIPVALSLRPRSDFVETSSVKEWTERALTYLAAGFPVHFRGPAGTGKTTLALHIAAQLGRPVTLIAGDEEFGTSDMIGGQYGYHYRKVIDRYVHSVLKYEEDAVQRPNAHRGQERLDDAAAAGRTLRSAVARIDEERSPFTHQHLTGGLPHVQDGQGRRDPAQVRPRTAPGGHDRTGGQHGPDLAPASGEA